MRIEFDDRRLRIFQELERGSSGERIAEMFGISRVAVWKFVRRLEEMGYTIEVDRRDGYRITGTPDPSPYHMALSAMKIPGVRKFVYLREVDSTNRVAKELDSALVFAEAQTSGRGRLGRNWVSERGGIYMSASMDFRVPVSEIPKITLLFGLAVCRALEEYGARIKWPNDVLVRGKKVSGILSEFTGEDLAAKVVVGVGINVKNRIPEELKDRAISLSEVSEDVSITGTFSRVCEEISKLVNGFPENWSAILDEWRAKSDTLKREVRVNLHGEVIEGVALDVDEDGALIVRTRKGLERVISGECFYTNY